MADYHTNDYYDITIDTETLGGCIDDFQSHIRQLTGLDEILVITK